MLGLPDHVTALLFDLDGVLTDTASVHDQAWKATFDAFLRDRDGQDYRPFDPVRDYGEFVDGKPREAGVRDFLASRGITVSDETVQELGDRKNRDLLRRIDQDGVRVYEGSRRYLQAAQAAGLRRAVVSSSANTRQVLEVTGLAQFVEERVDGVTLREQHLAGKPSPDSFLAGAKALGVDPSRAAVFEDALSGVEAGRAGGFGAVVGVDRVGHAEALREHGATVVVQDLAELLGGRR
ncbi:beta-phosphoglucomutase family hydrolase [Kineococcus sp. NBC_00420]|uniref:beta-phosphoglucomutase family hydrolase n=1 Tax=Kineococcus sp. NBC_00420 TaxID=2903564 RepID=UPI002E1AB845